MSRYVKAVVMLLAGVLVLGACEQQEPEFTEEDQVRAEDRPQDEPDEDAPDNGNGNGEVDGTFVAIDIDWESVPDQLPAGQMTLELVNDGGIEHDLLVDETGDEVVGLIGGGETETGTVDLEPGTYTFYCDVAGHREAGMEEQVEVVE